jgi:hypothetical protein
VSRLAFVVLLTAACGAPVAASGTIQGVPFTARGLVAFDTPRETLLAFVSTPITCAELAAQHPRGHADDVLYMLLWNSSGDMQMAAGWPNPYTIGHGPAEASVTFLHFDASCLSITEGATATAGTITVTSVDGARIAGHFDVTFDSGSASGHFDVEKCKLPDELYCY